MFGVVAGRVGVGICGWERGGGGMIVGFWRVGRIC